jgi:hypothetical protein
MAYTSMASIAKCCVIYGIALCLVSCGGGGTGTVNPLPLGAPVSGVTLAGPLASKTMYLLPASVNPSHCWMDSVAWTGTELFYGISSINWTSLTQLSAIVYDPACLPQPGFASPGTGTFNIYRAVVRGGSWVLSNLPVNDGQTVSVAAPKISSNTLAYVKYEKTSAAGNIYLATRTGDNSYSSSVAFSGNSANCDDGNPDIFGSGTQMIFESSRADQAATSCSATLKGLWISQYDGASWSPPVAIAGAPAHETAGAFQPWVDANQANLYWTATGATDCAGSVTTCVKTAAYSGGTPSTTATQIITPTAVASWSNGVVGYVGQYTSANGYSFVTCGIVADIDPTGSTTGLIFGRYKINFNICAIPLN